MKAHLLYRDRDFDWQWALDAAAAREAGRTGRRYQAKDFDPRAGLPWNVEALTRDLELDTLFTAMAKEDDLVYDVVRRVVLGGLQTDLATIRYRQAVLQDCLDHPAVVRELYALAGEAAEAGSKHYLGTLSRYPDWLLRQSIELMDTLLGMIRSLRTIAHRHAHEFASEGWSELFATLKRELDEEYCAGVQAHLKELRFRNGILLSAELGKGHKARRYVLHRPPDRKLSWLARLLPQLFPQWPPVFGFSLHPRDESGARILQELQGRGLAIAANALAQAADHVRSFFNALRVELAFYVGCLNLYEDLAHKGEPICMPSPALADEHRLAFRGLYDVCLSLNMGERVVGNDADADGKDLIVITGANQGGKSTFLRSLGLAQLMMQSGLFVPARSFSSSLCDGLFTHFKREEDVEMKSGKLDEELKRMSEIIDRITPRPMILFNESFAATNEREGSEIATQVLSALLARRTRMACVTHLYELARGFYERRDGHLLFLRAERRPDGTRPFRLVEGEPLPTSFGGDLYDGIFGAAMDDEAKEPREHAAAARRAS